MRILYGLDRLPITLAADDPRLPAVAVDTGRLRLNSTPLPATAWDAGALDHPARMAALRSWLHSGCGDYNEPLRRAITHYLDAVALHVEHHRDVLTASLARFHGLYRVEDWCWSAPRPLPRAWWLQDGVWQRAELAFWDGGTVMAMPPRDLMTDELPTSFQRFWNGETLPVSPFRRDFPGGPDGLSLRPTSPDMVRESH